MAARDFPRFRDLPTELRLEIWSHCLPGPQVVEMDFPVSDNHLTVPAGSRRVLWPRSPPQASQALPLISRVCREARSVALALGRRYQYVADDTRQKDDDGASCPSWESDWDVKAPVRFRKGLDIVHLNWHKGYDDSIWDPPECPLPAFPWLVNQAAAGSVSADLLLPFDPVRENPYTTFPTSFDDKDMKYFTPGGLYYAVLAIVEIHMSAKEAARAGVFGLFEKEPIQLVDPRDTARLATFREAWRRHHQTEEARSRLGEELDVAEFFSDVVDNADAYLARVEQWRENVEKAWVYKKGLELGVPYATRVEFWPNFAEATVDEDFDEDGNRPGVPYNWRVNWNTRVLVREHPWVQEQLELMPRFEPAVMFRHCVGSCGPV